MANDVQQRVLTREEQEEKRIAARRQEVAVAIANAAPEIARLAGIGNTHLDGGALAAQWKLASRKTPQLVDCSTASIIQSIATATAVGLRFDGAAGHGYLVPFKGECAFIAGYRGLIDLAVASGAVKTIHVDVACDGDLFEYEDGTAPVVRHRRAWRDRGAPYAVWAVAHHGDGITTQAAMGWAEVMAVKAKSPASRKAGSPWGGSPEDVIEMAKKTAIRRLFKILAVNPDRHRALLLALEADDIETTVIDAETTEAAPPASRTAALAEELARDLPQQLPESTGGEAADLSPGPERVTVPAQAAPRQSQAAMDWGKK